MVDHHPAGFGLQNEIDGSPGGLPVLQDVGERHFDEDFGGFEPALDI